MPWGECIVRLLTVMRVAFGCCVQILWSSGRKGHGVYEEAAGGCA